MYLYRTAKLLSAKNEHRELVESRIVTGIQISEYGHKTRSRACSDILTEHIHFYSDKQLENVQCPTVISSSGIGTVIN